MTACKLLIGTFLFVIGVSACSKIEDAQGIVGTWQLEEEFDGYANGGNFQWSLVSEEGKITLIFSADGAYQQIRPGNAICDGTYLLLTDQMITIDTECQLEPYTQEMSIENDVLLLTYMGREGHIIQKYLRQE